MSKPSLALEEALDAIADDGRIPREASRLLRTHLSQIRDEIPDFVGRRPEEILGRFEELSPAAQAALADAIQRDEFWRLRGYDLGGRYAALIRLLRSKRFRRFAGPAGPFLIAALVSGPARGLHAMYGLALAGRWNYSPRVGVDAVLKGAGIDPRSLSVCYARSLLQPAAFRGFWQDPARHITVGSMLGIDLLCGPEGTWFVESNLDAGLEVDRTALYDRDPFVSNLLSAAKEGGYRQLIIMAGNASVDALMARQYEEGAKLHGIRVRIVDDARRPSRFEHSHGIPTVQEDDTLVVRINFCRTNLDYLFSNKKAGYRALRAYTEQTGDPGFLLPSTELAPQVTNPDAADPFPNIVYKFADRDRGEGVFFVKATSPAHARSLVAEATRLARPRDLVTRLHATLGDQAGIYQPYVRGFLLPGRRLYKVRAHVLLTPLGDQYLSAHRVVSRHPVPETLPFGLVRDPGPYVVNFHRGAEYALIPAEEEERIRKGGPRRCPRFVLGGTSYGFQTTENA